jgi:beta-lactam-binding protein with PASTA domain
MPNVVGKDLDTATAELDSKGIQYALNSNGKPVILKFDWGVCATSPAAGQPVSGVAVLTLGHFSCGA